MKNFSFSCGNWSWLHSEVMTNKLFCLLIMLISCSCQSYQNISKGKELNEATIRAKLKPGKSYLIKLNYGKVMRLNVTHVDSISIYAKEKVKTKMGNGRHSNSKILIRI